MKITINPEGTQSHAQMINESCCRNAHYYWLGCALLLMNARPKFKRRLAGFVDLHIIGVNHGNADLSEHAQCSIKQSGPDQSA